MDSLNYSVSILPMQKPLYFSQGHQKEKPAIFCLKALSLCKWPFVGGEKKQIGHSVLFLYGQRWHDDSSATASTWKPTTLNGATCLLHRFVSTQAFSASYFHSAAS